MSVIDDFFIISETKKALLLLDLRAVFDIIEYSIFICFKTNKYELKVEHRNGSFHKDY